MPSTQKLIIVSLALIAGIGLGFLLSKTIVTEAPVSYEESPGVSVTAAKGDFKKALLPLLDVRFGATNESYNSHELMYVYPGIQAEDFNGVETISGHYEFKDGFLWHIGDTEENQEDVTDAGFEMLHKNIRARLALETSIPVETLVLQIENPSTTDGSADPMPLPPEDGDTPVENPEEPTMCPMDAKMCSDGSFVGRTAPGCAFAACPDGAPPTNGEIVCTPEQREAEACIEIYAPVCASYQVQCITEPCNPVPKSYSNSCFACADNKVISYTEGGVCASDPLSSE